MNSIFIFVTLTSGCIIGPTVAEQNAFSFGIFRDMFNTFIPHAISNTDSSKGISTKTATGNPTGTASGTGTGTRTGTGTATGTATGTGSDSGTASGTRSNSGTVTGTGSDSGTATETRSDSGTVTGTTTGTGNCVEISVCTCSTSDLDFISQSLTLQNCYRGFHHVSALVQDAALNAAAQKYADLLAANIKAQNCASVGDCSAFKHSPEATTGQYGENLALIPSAMANVVCIAVQVWYVECKDYDFSNPGFSHAAGHFTALVWKETTAVGTGKADTTIGGDDYTVVVSNYSPPGNNVAKFPSNVLPN